MLVAGALGLAGSTGCEVATYEPDHVVTGTSADGSLAAAVAQFCTLLGTLNPNDPTPLADGRRQINWDGVPDAQSVPFPFSADFFNGTVSPRARGVEFATDGTGFRVSAGPGNPSLAPTLFGEIDPSYPSEFGTFSAEKLFTASGSNELSVWFFLAGSTTPAVTRGFGAIFADVDDSANAWISFRSGDGSDLGAWHAPAAPGQKGLSFVGTTFSEAIIGEVIVHAGDAALGSGVVEPAHDVVALDDFIYGEPQPR